MVRSRRSSLSSKTGATKPSLPVKVKRGSKVLPAVKSASVPRTESTQGGLVKLPECKVSGVLKKKGSCLRLQPATPDVNFWKGICRPSLLVHALANIGTLVEADPALPLASSQPHYPFSALTLDRLLTAIQAIFDAYCLLRHVIRESGNGHAQNATHDQKLEHVRALIQLAESAVPMKQSVLSYSVSGSSDTVPVFPTTPLRLRERLQRLQRLLKLRQCHVRIMTALRHCKTKSEVAALFFGTGMGNTDNSVEPMPGITSWHQKEQGVIEELVVLVNAIAPCSESWGASSMTSQLCVAGGSYIFHRRARFETLTSLLGVAEFFGLPPFLRSIRIARGHQPGLQSRSATALPAAESRTHHAMNLPFSIFVSPCDLDLRFFDELPPSHAHVVQEELIDLACRHCRFGALVGEADQIVALLSASGVPQRQTKTEMCDELTETVKGACGAGEALLSQTVTVAEGAGSSDLLSAYAQSLARAASDEAGNKYARVHWLCSNCWSPTMSYYALVIATVPEEISDDVVWNAEEMEHENGHGGATAPYYIAAVLELVRF